MKGPSSGWRVFGAPIVIGALTAAGLSAGLLWGEGGRHLAWACVGAPVAVAAWVWLRVQFRHRSGVIPPGRYRRE